MITVSQALGIALDSAPRLPHEKVELERALGRVLAEDIRSDIDIPNFDKAAMDGYACRKTDILGDLKVIETIAAGDVPGKDILPGQCAKIMTGAMMPKGADCVIIVEEIQKLEGGMIRFLKTETNANIRKKGEDLKRAGVLLAASDLIKPQHIAVLAMAGCMMPLVAKVPKVGIIATGSELVEPGTMATGAKIRNSNSFGLRAQLLRMGIAAKYYGIACDTFEAIDSLVKDSIRENDVTLLSGGVSMGDFDLVPAVLKANDMAIKFDRVAIKPGKPLAFSCREGVFCFGMPGNPVSTFSAFEMFVKPFLYRMMGYNYAPLWARGKLEAEVVVRSSERESYLPGYIDAKTGSVKPLKYHGSAHINALCLANCLIQVKIGTSALPKGSEVAIRSID